MEFFQGNFRTCVHYIEPKKPQWHLHFNTFLRSWQHVSTPMFIITSQWNGKKFDEITCNLDPEKDQNYGAYVTGDI